MAKKENATKNFVLRIDAEMMDAIETWAADEFRSTNGQIQYILDQALRKAGRLKKKKQLGRERRLYGGDSRLCRVYAVRFPKWQGRQGRPGRIRDKNKP